jgi:hypothetical protein
MKRLGLYLISGAIVLTVADFFTLGNSQFFAPSRQLDQMAFSVFVVAGLLFLTGLIKLIKDLFSSEWMARRREKIDQEIVEGERATRTERAIRIVIAILAAIPTVLVSVMMPLIGLIVSIPYIFLAIYLLFNRRHHLIFNSLLLLVAIYLYFFSSNHFFQYYKMAELSFIPGSGDTPLIGKLFLAVLFVGGKFLFMLTASWLVLADILVKVKSQTIHRWRGLVNLGTLLVLAIILLLLPYAYQPKIKLGEGTSGDTSGNGASHFAMDNTSTNMAFDQNTRQYVFTATLRNGTGETGPIVRIVVDGKDLEISPSNKDLTVENGTVSDTVIGIVTGQTGTLKIFSEKPFYCVSLLEKGFRYSNCFLK